MNTQMSEQHCERMKACMLLDTDRLMTVMPISAHMHVTHTCAYALCVRACHHYICTVIMNYKMNQLKSDKSDEDMCEKCTPPLGDNRHKDPHIGGTEFLGQNSLEGDRCHYALFAKFRPHGV